MRKIKRFLVSYLLVAAMLPFGSIAFAQGDIETMAMTRAPLLVLLESDDEPHLTRERRPKLTLS